MYVLTLYIVILVSSWLPLQRVYINDYFNCSLLNDCNSCNSTLKHEAEKNQEKKCGGFVSDIPCNRQ